MTNGLNNAFDWILNRKRCPFCVEPFPVLKCLAFEAWQCPKCEVEFRLDEEGALDPVIKEYYQAKNHFPKSLNSATFNENDILCPPCADNQQKIVQLLQAFEPSKSREQYELYAAKLDTRYPLCSTCSFRVSAKLKESDEMAKKEERRNMAKSTGEIGWQNKLRLAQEMRWGQIKRRLVKGVFFWPDFAFQLLLTFKCIFKLQKDIAIAAYSTSVKFSDYNISVWLPDNNNLSLSSLYFAICSLLFAIQFNGVAMNGRGFFDLLPQLCLLGSRVLIGNFLYRPSASGIDLNLVLTLTAISLAIVFKTGSRNWQVKKKSSGGGGSFVSRKSSNLIFAKTPVVFDNPVSTNNQNVLVGKSNGFASYSDKHHQYHSFANQVADKPIMPWSEKPLPGKLNSPKLVDENRFMNLNGLLNNERKDEAFYRMRPTRLVSDDPLELEPMFSSFSLSDEPKNRRNTRSTVIKPTSSSTQVDRPCGIIAKSVPKQQQQYQRYKQMSMKELLRVFYNILLTTILSALRIYLLNQAALVAIVLALTFGLRGFLWPRLDLKVQLVSLSVAVGRLIWLGAVVNGRMEAEKLGYLAVAIDLILIILR